MSKILESGFESVVLTLLGQMGFTCHSGDAFDPDTTGERDSYHGAMLPGRLKSAVARINPELPPEAVAAAANAVLDVRFTELIQENQRIRRLLVDGVPVEYQRGGETIHDRARLVDWQDARNEWLAVNQMTMVGASKRRTDILIFLNGLPLVVMEHKGPEAKNDTATGEVSYGFAHYVRKGLPNATFVGFTGTPIEMVDKNTQQVFGDYIDVYDITQAVEDCATVPIHYEGKIVRLKLDADTKVAVDAAFDEVTEGMEDSEKARFAGKWSTLEALAGASERLDELAALIVDHFEKRQQAISGKGMIVCMSRRICVDLYNRITKLRPAWHDPADDKGKLKVVMTGSAADPQAYQPHIRNKQGRDNLAKRYRDPGDEFQLVIVRDMWLTGFDCPSMHTIYIDKPMHGHGLMQAIARVNRIFTGNPSGLVVDTIGIATDLKEALAFYSDRDRGNTGINTDEAVLALRRCLDVLRSMFHGIDYGPALKGNDGARLKILGQALNHVYGLEGERARTPRRRQGNGSSTRWRSWNGRSSCPRAGTRRRQ